MIACKSGCDNLGEIVITKIELVHCLIQEVYVMPEVDLKS